MGTSNDVLMFCRLRHRRHGRLGLEPVLAGRQGDRLRRPENSASAGRKSPKPTAWTPTCLTCPTARWLRPQQVEAALAAEPATKAVFVQASETSTGAAHDVRAMAAAVEEDRRHLRGGRHHRARHHAARYRRLGPRRGDRRVAEGLHDSAGPGVPVDQPQGLEVRRNRHAAALLLQSQEGKEERRRRRIELDAVHLADSGAGRSAEIREAARHGEPDRERATAGPGHARRGA